MTQPHRPGDAGPDHAARHRHPPVGGTAPITIALRLLASTDLHMQLLAFDYFRGRGAPPVDRGLERLASLIACNRAEADNTLLFDNGDLLQGNQLADHLAASLPGAPRRARSHPGTHPAIASLNMLQYDAATLGNHDFSYGGGFLARVLQDAAFPVVVANARLPALARRVRPWVILQRQLRDGAGGLHHVGIGVIGFLPPQTSQWEAAAVPDLRTEDIIEAATREVPLMRAAGASVVVALAHAGVSPPPHRRGNENAAAALAALPGIDAVIAGHTHDVIPPTGKVQRCPRPGPAPLVMAGFAGSHLGVIDLALRQGPYGRGWRVAQAEARVLAAGGDPGAAAAAPAVTPATVAASTGAASTVAPPAIAFADANAATISAASITAIRQAALPAHRAALRAGARRVGRTAVPLGSHLAMLGQDGGLRLVAMAQRWHMRAALAGGPHAGLPILVTVSPFRAGGRGGPGHFTQISTGRITHGDLADLYAFTNRAAAVLVSGAELADWLERAAAAFLPITPGRPDQELIDPDFPSYNFDMIDGLGWQLDLSQPARYAPDGFARSAPGSGRVRALTHAGRPVRPDQQFVLATNGYRLSGVGLYSALTAGRTPIYQGAERVRDLVRAYLRQRRVVAPAAHPMFSLARVPGASAVIRTGPQAAPHIAATRPMGLTITGLDEAGFLTLRLPLDPAAATD